MSAAWRKSSYSGNGGQNCVEVAGWRKSSYSTNGGQNCVEVAGDGAVLIRDTTDRDGVTLSVPADAWAKFTASLR